MLRILPSPLLALAIAASFTACGSGNSSHTNTRSNRQDASVREVAKAAFIKQADAICRKTDGRQTAAVKAHSKHRTATTTEEEQLIAKFALPEVREEAEEIATLEAPSGDEAKIEAIVKGIEEAVGKAEADPASVLTSSGPFAPVEKLAGEFGFKVCNSPA